jgi:hypothetical protein
MIIEVPKPIIEVPKPSGKIAFDSFAGDLSVAFRGGSADPAEKWKAVARVAVRWAGQVLPEEHDPTVPVSPKSIP